MEIQTKLNWQTFEPKFGTWAQKIKPFFDRGGFDKIFEFIKSESKTGKVIAPESINLWRAFRETSLDNLKCVIVGLSPYHTLKDGKIIADGLLMGASITNHVPPTLDQFYNALEQEFYDGVNVNMYKNPDVSYLANQGVLMLNASLTAEIGKAGTHLAIWEPFIKFLFEEIINDTNVPVVFLGKEAARYDKYTQIFSTNFLLSHPASASYNNKKWSSEGAFNQISKIIKDSNNFQIEWITEK